MVNMDALLYSAPYICYWFYMESNVTLISFLGNPGQRYSKTRHNAARIYLERLESQNTMGWQNKFRGSYAVVHPGNSRKMYVYRSRDFMNNSGAGIQEICSFFSIPATEILVVYDDLDISLGKWKLQRGGGLKGHNGLRSINQHLHSRDFMRCAIGIDRPPNPAFSVESWVLSAFGEEDMASLETAFKQIDKLFYSILGSGTIAL